MHQILSFASYAPNSYLESRYWIDSTFIATWTCDREKACPMLAPFTGLVEVLSDYPLAQLVEP